MVHGGGPVIDGKANIYLVFWIDATFLPASPRFVSLTKQFVQDIGTSPLYTATLSQYPDSQNRRPACAVLAGSVVDTQPFPPNLVAAWKNGAGSRNAIDKLSDTIWKNKLLEVAEQQGWDTKDYHNIFTLMPTINWGPCGYHQYFRNGGQRGSPWMYISYPYIKNTGQIICATGPGSPNNDRIADVTVDTLSHEIIEAVNDPYLDAWRSRGLEISDKCQYIPLNTIDPKTKGNVIWNGHPYLVQEHYSNRRHGCVVGGL